MSEEVNKSATSEQNADTYDESLVTITKNLQEFYQNQDFQNLYSTLNRVPFIISSSSTDKVNISKLFDIIFEIFQEIPNGRYSNILITIIHQILADKSLKEHILIQWKQLFELFYSLFLTHSKLCYKTYSPAFASQFISIIIESTEYFTPDSATEIENLLLPKLDYSNPQFILAFCLLCIFLPPNASEAIFLQIFDIYTKFNTKSLDNICLKFLIRYLKNHDQQNIDTKYIILLFNKFVSKSDNNVAFQSDIDLFCSDSSCKSLYAELFVLLIKSNEKTLSILQKLMKIFDSKYDNEFIESVVYHFHESNISEAVKKSFVQIVLPVFIHIMFTPPFSSKNLHFLVDLSPQYATTAILDAVENIKDKQNIVNALIEINDAMGNNKDQIEDYYLEVLSIVDDISSVDTELTLHIFKLYARFTSVFPIDDSLSDWINSVFTKAIEISQVSILEKEIQENIRQLLINILSSADGEMLWSLMETFRENMDQILCENIGPFVDAFPISTFIDFCFNEEAKVNYFIVQRLLKNSGLFLDDKVATMIKSSICNADQSIRKIGKSIVKQTLLNLLGTYPHYMPFMKKPQLNKPSNDFDKARMIFNLVLKTIQANFNGKDYQTQIDYIETLKVLLDFSHFDENLSIEIINYLTSLQVNMMHSNVISKIIESFAVIFEYKSNKYEKPENLYQKAKIEIINESNCSKSVSPNITNLIYSYLCEFPVRSLKQNVVESIVKLLTAASKIDPQFADNFEKFISKFKENKDENFFKILNVFVENVEIVKQFNQLSDLIQTLSETEHKDERNDIIDFLDSVDFYSSIFDTDTLLQQRIETMSKLIDMTETHTEIKGFVIAVISSFIDGKRFAISSKPTKFVINCLISEDQYIRKTALDALTKIIEYLIPRTQYDSSNNDLRLTQRKKKSVIMSNTDKQSNECLSNYFKDDVNERIEIYKILDEFLADIHHCLELIVADDEPVFSQSYYKFFIALMRFYGAKFTEIIFEIAEHLFETGSFSGAMFANECISAFINTYHYTNDQKNSSKLFEFITKYSHLMIIPSSLCSSKDPKKYEFITDYILTLPPSDDLYLFALPFAVRNEKLREQILSNIQNSQIISELSAFSPEQIFEKQMNNNIFSLYLTTLFNEQSISSIAAMKIMNEKINQIFDILSDEKSEDETIENITNAIKSISFYIDQGFPFNFTAVDQKWLVLVSQLEILEALFDSAVFSVDEHASDIILDFLVPCMMIGTPEIIGSAQRLLTLAFERFYSLQENIDVFVGVFSKMCQDDNSLSAGLAGLVSIVSGTPLFGSVPQYIADALTVLNDNSSSNPQISEFLSIFWSKYEDTFTPSASLCLSPIRKSLKSNIRW